MTYLVSSLALGRDSIAPLPQFESRLAVQARGGELSLLSNTCLHRGALLLSQPQDARLPVVCPLHRWTYADGELQGEPIPNPPRCLPRAPAHAWNGFIFQELPDLSDMPEGISRHFSLDGYVHTKTEVMEVAAPWQVFMEVYLDLYHVRAYHPGLGNFVDMSSYRWHFGRNWSLQEVGFTKQPGRNPDPRFAKVETLLAEGGQLPEHGALWLTIYPNVTLEVYPNMLVASTVWPTADPRRCLNVIEHHHLEEVAAFSQEYVTAQLDAYYQAAQEDAEICERIAAGRTGAADSYPIHPELERGIGKFYQALEERPELQLRVRPPWLAK